MSGHIVISLLVISRGTAFTASDNARRVTFEIRGLDNSTPADHFRAISGTDTLYSGSGNTVTFNIFPTPVSETGGLPAALTLEELTDGKNAMIKYYLPSQQHVRMTPYNVLGQKIKTLVDGEENAGTHTVTWEGRNNAGKQVAKQMLLYVLETPGGEFEPIVRKMIYMGDAGVAYSASPAPVRYPQNSGKGNTGSLGKTTDANVQFRSVLDSANYVIPDTSIAFDLPPGLIG